MHAASEEGRIILRICVFRLWCLLPMCVLQATLFTFRATNWWQRVMTHVRRATREVAQTISRGLSTMAPCAV